MTKVAKKIKETTSNSLVVCSKCGSDSVRQLKWVNPNTSSIIDNITGYVLEGEIEHCEICNGTTTLVDQSEFTPSTVQRVQKLWEDKYFPNEGRYIDEAELYDFSAEIMEELGLSGDQEDTVLDFLYLHLNVEE